MTAVIRFFKTAYGSIAGCSAEVAPVINTNLIDSTTLEPLIDSTTLENLVES